MNVTESDISRSTQAAWKAVFGRPLVEASAGKKHTGGKPWLLARVRIMGSMQRALLIACPLEEARAAAAAFFGRDAADMDEALVRDVFGELANMIAGLIKRHFPHATQISLPEVTETPGETAEGRVVVQVLFEFGASPLAVKLVQNLS